MIKIEPLEFISSLIEYNGKIIETKEDVLTHEIVYKLQDNSQYVIVRSARTFNVVGVYRAD